MMSNCVSDQVVAAFARASSAGIDEYKKSLVVEDQNSEKALATPQIAINQTPLGHLHNSTTTSLTLSYAKIPRLGYLATPATFRSPWSRPLT